MSTLPAIKDCSGGRDNVWRRWLATRSNRWDVYPQAEKEVTIEARQDSGGFWEFRAIAADGNNPEHVASCQAAMHPVLVRVVEVVP